MNNGSRLNERKPEKDAGSRNVSFNNKDYKDIEDDLVFII
jgi:hypothetical protein